VTALARTSNFIIEYKRTEKGKPRESVSAQSYRAYGVSPLGSQLPSFFSWVALFGLNRAIFVALQKGDCNVIQNACQKILINFSSNQFQNHLIFACYSVKGQNTVSPPQKFIREGGWSLP
jgi:hypothetical protein